MEPINNFNFANRLEQLANLTEQRYDSIRLNRDLSISNKTAKEQLPLVGAFFNTAPQFDQIAEFFGALDTLKKEIEKNDFAFLKDEEGRQFMPQAWLTLKKLHLKWMPFCDWSIWSKTVEKIDSIKTLIFCHMPLQNRLGYPRLNTEYFNRFFESTSEFDSNISVKLGLCDEYVKNWSLLLKELETLTISSDEKYIDRLRHLIVLGHEVGRNSEMMKWLFPCVNNLSFLLFEQSVLTAYQFNFLEQVFKSNFNDHYRYPSSRAEDFKVYLHARIDSCLQSYESPLEILSTFHHICNIAACFTKFMETDKESPFDPISPDKINSVFDRRGLEFREQKLELVKMLLPVLHLYINDVDAKSKLKDILLYSSPNGQASYLEDLILEFQRGDLHQISSNINTNRLQIDLLHRSGFLVPEGEYLRLSDGWIRVIETLVPNPQVFLNAAFSALNQLSEKNPRRIYYRRFLRGSSPIRYPKYLIQHVFHGVDQEMSAFLIKKMAGLNPVASRTIVCDTIDVELHEKYLQLYEAAEEASNSYFKEWSLKALGMSLLEVFSKNSSKPFLFPERIFIQLVNRLSLDDMNGKYRSCISLDVKRLPLLTCAGLSALLNKIPDLNVLHFDYAQRSSLSDLSLSHNGEVLYMNSAILKRSSEYFECMLRPYFKEGSMEAEEVELSKEHFVFFKKWIDVVFQPHDNFFKRNLIEFSEIHLRLGNTPNTYLEELTLAHTYQMPYLFDLMDKLYTLMITPPKSYVAAPEIEKEVIVFKDKARTNEIIRNKLMDLKQSQFALTLGL